MSRSWSDVEGLAQKPGSPKQAAPEPEAPEIPADLPDCAIPQADPSCLAEAAAPPATNGNGARVIDQVLGFFAANPGKAFKSNEVVAALPHLSENSIRVYISTLKSKGKLVAAGYGRASLAPAAGVIVSTPAPQRRMTPAPKPPIAPPPQPQQTPLQKTAYLRNLMKRACIAVQIDLKLTVGHDRDIALEKLERWGEKLFDMGYRAALGIDVPKDADAREAEIVQ